MRFKVRVRCAIVIWRLCATSGGGGVCCTGGTAGGFWLWYTLVYAEVVGVSSIPGPPYLLTLDVIATLRGFLDPVEINSIAATAEFVPSGLLRDAQGHRKVLVLLRRDARGNFVVPPDVFWFMPERHAILEVKGLEDNSVRTVIRALRVLRDIKHDPHRELKEFQEKMRNVEKTP